LGKVGNRDSFLIAAAAAVCLVFAAAVYLPDIGRGFVKDDFTWIRDGRAMRADVSHALQPDAPGFYRPLVTATFAFDDALHGLNARAYGFTNLALYLLCIGAIWMLGREAGIGAGGAAVGALAWAVNPHGINMAVVWLSGRTSLMLTLFAALSALAFLRRRRVAGALLLSAALLSKEEATLLPVILLAWLWLLREGIARDRMLDAVAIVSPAIVYALLRMQTPTLTPATAPWFYRPTFDAGAIAANVLQYADRSLTIFVVVALMAALVLRGRAAIPRPIVVAGAVWIAGGFALTIWLPVRSSLYAVFPSVGSALVCGAFVDRLRSVHRDPAADLRLAAALASVLAFIPIYQSRNDRWVEPARLSARVVRALQANAPAPDASGVIVFEDDDREHASFRDALGSLASEAVLTTIRRPFHAEVVSDAREWNGPVAARYRLTNGRVERLQ
jgi:hypothetical protein